MKITLDIQVNDDESVTATIENLPDAVVNRLKWLSMTEGEREAAHSRQRAEAMAAFQEFISSRSEL